MRLCATCGPEMRNWKRVKLQGAADMPLTRLTTALFGGSSNPRNLFYTSSNHSLPGQNEGGKIAIVAHSWNFWQSVHSLARRICCHCGSRASGWGIKGEQVRMPVIFECFSQVRGTLCERFSPPRFSPNSRGIRISGILLGGHLFGQLTTSGLIGRTEEGSEGPRKEAHVVQDATRAFQISMSHPRD